MANKLKHKIVSLPVVGYSSRLASNIANLPKLYEQLLNNQNHTNNVIKTLHAELAKTNAALKQSNVRAEQQAEELQLTIDDLQQQFSLFETAQSSAKTKPSKATSQGDTELFADDHLMDAFYTAFEDKFRGAEDMISERLEEYLPLFTDSELDFKKTPVLDIGSGRGELLSLLAAHNVKAIGLDINHDMVKRSKDKGLEAIQGDALAHLQSEKPQSYGAITGFHLVEHIPFNILLRMFKACHTSLTKGGFVIFETPNPENLTVGSTTFYMDPSHLSPLPPLLLAFALETCGFKNVEIRRIHPNEDKHEPVSKELEALVFGARDYAVVAYK